MRVQILGAILIISSLACTAKLSTVDKENKRINAAGPLSTDQPASDELIESKIESTNTSLSTSALEVVPSLVSLDTGESITLSISGGAAPYAIDADSSHFLVSSLTFLAIRSGTGSILVSDALGTEIAVPYVVANNLELELEGTEPFDPGQAVKLTARGGTGPYLFEVDGLGELNEDEYVYPWATGQSTLTVSDSYGNTAQRLMIRPQFVQQFGTAASDSGYQAFHDADGNMYLCGNTESALPGEVHYGASDLVITKLSKFGQLIWRKQYGTSAADYYIECRLSKEEHPVIAFTMNADFLAHTYLGGSDIAVFSIDAADGSVLWSHVLASNLLEKVYSFIDDGNGSIYWSGLYSGNSLQQVFVQKIRTLDGQVLWSNFVDTGTSYRTDMELTASGNQLVVIGGTDSLGAEIGVGYRKCFVIMLDVTNGSPGWQKLISAETETEFIECRQVSIDPNTGTIFTWGDLYVNGYTVDRNNGNYTYGLWALNPDGDLLWHKKYAESGGYQTIFSKPYTFADGQGGLITTIGSTIQKFGFSTTGEYYMQRLDADGDVVWQRQFENSVYSDYPLKKHKKFADHVNIMWMTPAVDFKQTLNLYRISLATGATLLSSQIYEFDYGEAAFYQGLHPMFDDTIAMSLTVSDKDIFGKSNAGNFDQYYFPIELPPEWRQ